MILTRFGDVFMSELPELGMIFQGGRSVSNLIDSAKSDTPIPSGKKRSPTDEAKSQADSSAATARSRRIDNNLRAVRSLLSIISRHSDITARSSITSSTSVRKSVTELGKIDKKLVTLTTINRDTKNRMGQLLTVNRGIRDRMDKLITSSNGNKANLTKIATSTKNVEKGLGKLEKTIITHGTGKKVSVTRKSISSTKSVSQASTVSNIVPAYASERLSLPRPQANKEALAEERKQTSAIYQMVEAINDQKEIMLREEQREKHAKQRDSAISAKPSKIIDVKENETAKKGMGLLGRLGLGILVTRFAAAILTPIIMITKAAKVIGGAILVAGKVLKTITGFFGRISTWFKGLGKHFQGIARVFSRIRPFLKIFSRLLGLIPGIGWVILGLVTFGKDVFELIYNFYNNMRDGMGIVDAAGDAFMSLLKNIWQGWIVDPYEWVMGLITGKKNPSPSVDGTEEQYKPIKYTTFQEELEATKLTMAQESLQTPTTRSAVNVIATQDSINNAKSLQSLDQKRGGREQQATNNQQNINMPISNSQTNIIGATGGVRNPSATDLVGARVSQ